MLFVLLIFFFQAEDGIRDKLVTGVQTCALPICVDHHRHLPQADAEGFGGARVVDLVHHLHFEEMVPRAESAELASATLTRALRDLARVGPVEAAAGLDPLGIVRHAVAALYRPRRAA